MTIVKGVDQDLGPETDVDHGMINAEVEAGLVPLHHIVVIAAQALDLVTVPGLVVGANRPRKVKRN